MRQCGTFLYASPHPLNKYIYINKLKICILLYTCHTSTSNTFKYIQYTQMFTKKKIVIYNLTQKRLSEQILQSFVSSRFLLLLLPFVNVFS